MNLPNKLTVFRAVMVPVFLAVFFVEQIPARFILSALIFAGLSFTDMLDGKIARKNGLVTNFGKFLDPLADKILVISALVAMTVLKTGNEAALICWLVGVIIILAREFMVSALRLVSVEQGSVIAANMWGKVKTVTQFLSIIIILTIEQLFVWFPALPAEIKIIGDVLFALSVLATIVSGVIYVKQNAANIGEM